MTDKKPISAVKSSGNKPKPKADGEFPKPAAPKIPDQEPKSPDKKNPVGNESRPRLIIR
jgi:hypothetical protein